MYNESLNRIKLEHDADMEQALKEYQERVKQIKRVNKGKWNTLTKNHRAIIEDYKTLNRSQAIPITTDSHFLSKLGQLKKQASQITKLEAQQIIKDVLNSNFTAHFTLCIKGGLMTTSREGNTNHLKNIELKATSQYLCIDSDHVLITGGAARNQQGNFAPYDANKAFLLNIISQELSVLPDLNIGRFFHGMTWIDGKPAVVGGLIDDQFTKTDSVEVFHCGAWQQAAHLVVPKGHLSTTSDFICAYAVGGVMRKYYLNDIERYYQGGWEILSVNIPLNLVQPGVFCVNEKLFIVGGMLSYDVETKTSTKSNAVHTVNLRSLKIKQRGDINFECSFLHNNWIVKDGEAMGYALTQNNSLELVKVPIE